MMTDERTWLSAEMKGEDGYYRQIKKWADKYWEQEEKRLSALLTLANNLNPPDVSD